MSTSVDFAPGSLVTLRGRDWIVMPKPTGIAPEVGDFICVKPLDGTDDETTCVLLEEEEPRPATFQPPQVEARGDYRSCRRLRDAARLAIRNGAGPFRSFGRLAFEPRPYQLAPLALALKQETTRLLIADDVGVGKTIETGMILRELLDRGEIRRFCVICPPHLAEQWRDELYEKFHLDAKLVLSHTIARLEKDCGSSESVFDVYPYTIVSIDFIKQDSYRDEFLRAAPEMIVFDEAHALATEVGTGRRQRRFALARDLCDDKTRNVLFVTATPHSGKPGAFRSLLGLLNEKFLDETRYPDDLSGPNNEKRRQELAEFFIQRRRADVRAFLGAETPFPTCKSLERPWSLSPEYKRVFDRALKLATEFVDGDGFTPRELRLRWWSALSLMRALASSPKAAAETLRQRSVIQREGGDDAEEIALIDRLGRERTLDVDALATEELADETLGLDADYDESNPGLKTRLKELATEAEALCSPERDYKLKTLIQELKTLLKDGFNPIVFCRFIATVEYLKAELTKPGVLPNGVQIEGVSGLLPAEERERRVVAAMGAPKRVLICTDCLSEGVNLQDGFDATIHYDLSWNPTRHEQREGRVDRFGQKKKEVRVVTFYGENNTIDGLVLDILLRKHGTIKKSLGVSVALPAETDRLYESIFNALLQTGRGEEAEKTRALPGMEEIDDAGPDLEEEKQKLHDDWDAQAIREQKQSQTYFAHVRTTKLLVDDLQRELDESRAALGNAEDAQNFLLDALQAAGADVVEEKNGVYALDLSPTAVPDALRDSIPDYDKWRASFSFPAPDDSEFVSRTHPLVEGVADYVLRSALDPENRNPLAARCGAIRTDAVELKTTLILLRARYRMTRKDASGAENLSIVEETLVVGYERSPANAQWLADDVVERVLLARAGENLRNEFADRLLKEALDALPGFESKIAEIAAERATRLKESHERAGAALKTKGRVDVVPEGKPDAIGVYVYIPKND